jgi:cytochrome c oxidase subunit 2
VKQDAVPGQIIPVWFEATKPGEYALTCAELCGWGHYKMKARVVAMPESEFEAAMEALEVEQTDDGFEAESENDE